MKIETEWAKIPLGFYLRREVHPGLANGQGGTVYTLQVKLNNDPPHSQPHVPAHEDSWRAAATTHAFWDWAQKNLPVWEANPRVKYSER